MSKWLLFAVLVATSACLPAVAAPGGGEDDPANSWFAQRSQAAVAQRQSVGSRSNAGNLVIAALNFLDTPYRSGRQAAQDGFDCSGFTRHVFAQALGMHLPRQADAQAHAPGLQPVPREQLRAGDLVFFNTLRGTFSHVGIYLGDDRFIHAPRAGANVRVESLAASYWSQRFTGARRTDILEQSP
jgi:cell wall-associated NlpC family hydrolase